MKTVLSNLLKAVPGTVFRTLTRGQGFTIIVLAVFLSSCTISGTIGGFPPEGRQQQPPVAQMPIGHICSNQNGQTCYFRTQLCRTQGLTRIGGTITFHQGGRFCHADGIDDRAWNYLRAGGCLEITAYHH